MSVSNDELDLAVLQEALDRYSDRIPHAELETLKQLIQSWKNQDDRAAQTLYNFVSNSEAIDEAYDHALLALRRQYNSQPRAKGLVLSMDYPTDPTGLVEVSDRLLGRLNEILQHPILQQQTSPTTFTQPILKALTKHPLRTQDLSFVINQPLAQTQSIVQTLWRSGYVDQLSAPLIYTLFPGLRSQTYRQQPVDSTTFLAITTKGYSQLYPLIQWARKDHA
jgi:hypothetical protein